MEDLKWITENINTALGALALAGATYAANWVRKVIRTYLNYLEMKMARWLGKHKETEKCDPMIDQVMAGLKIIRAILEKKHGTLENVDLVKRGAIVDQAYELIKVAMPEFARAIPFLKMHISSNLFKGEINADPAGR